MRTSASNLETLFIDEPIKIQHSNNILASIAFESLNPEAEDRDSDAFRSEKIALTSGEIEVNSKNELQHPVKISRTEIVFNVHSQVQFPEAARTSREPAVLKGNFIKGEIQNSQGLPFGGEYHIRVRQVKDNKEMSVGEVNAEFGQYKIPFSYLDGEVLAELVDSKGAIMGFDSYTINESTISKESGQFLGKKLVLKPRNNSLYSQNSQRSPQAEVPSNYDSVLNRSNRQFSKSRDGGMSAFSEVTQNLSSPSTSLIESRGRSSPPSLTLTLASNKVSLRAVDNLYLSSLIQVIETQTNSSFIDPNLGVIFGKVTFGDQELMGAKVEVEGLEDLTPVYFNTMMPDTNLPATSENGTFVIFNVPTGYFSLKVTVGGQYWSHESIVVRAGSVSQVEVRSTIQKSKVDVYAFDPLSGVPVKTILSTQATIGEFDAGFGNKILLSNINRESIYQVKAEGDYVAHSGFFNESQRQITIPRISETWLNSVTSPAVIQKNTGIVVGFVDSDHYEVFLPHEDKESGAQLIYFDSRGLRSEKSAEGGGFILLNVPADVQSVLIFDQEAEIFHSKVLPVDDGSLSVLRISKDINY